MSLPRDFPSREAVRYALRELARRAGLPEAAGAEQEGFESSGISVRYGPEKTPVEAPAIVIVPSAIGRWSELLTLPPNRLESVPLEAILPPGGEVPFAGPLPVLFRSAGQESARELVRNDGRGTVVFLTDLVATALFFLCRWEETVIAARDAHGRMPALAGLGLRQGCLDRPVVDQYAWILREWIRFQRPSWKPKPSRFRVRLSHDLDVVWPFRGPRSVARAVVEDVRARRGWRGAGRSLALAARQVLAPRRTPYIGGIERLCRISRRHSFPSAFYVMAADPGPYDNGYDPRSRRIRRRLQALRREGFELGFHPSYRTLGDPERLSSEKARLDGVLGSAAYGGRQHYLRFRVPDTWRDWESAGLSYDSTLTFADHEGFRCGTCHPYRPFDLERNRELRLVEVPLIVMDGTLRQYRGLTPAEGEARVRELARRCREVGGTFTLLWHNSSLDGEWDGWGEAYERMVGELAVLRNESSRDTGAEAGA